MQMRNLLQLTNNIKKSHILLIGSFFIFIGTIFISWDYLIRIKDEIYSNMKIAMLDKVDKNTNTTDQVIENIPNVENISETNETTNNEIDYSHYLGVLEIPKIRLKRGFYNVGSRYNNIQYNVTMISGSTLPDVENGNLILMAHSGDAYISYFAFLYKVNVGDIAYITYNGIRYKYMAVNIYEVPKNGIVHIKRNEWQKSLTLITCTKNNDYTQTVYVFEQIGEGW